MLITGVAGFIGMHTAKQLLEEGHEIVGIDNLNSYYDVELKKYRLNELNKENYDFTFKKLEITDTEKVFSLFEKFKFDFVYSCPQNILVSGDRFLTLLIE